ncbi:MFS transporter [Neorhizobium galegae]|uniref:MFS transporter n=1 Tax=Neorhizobium galegae TaxID=399 RepID=UPI0006211BC6|nr:MFS transporter [Neorhizobium galegae]CDZ29413.1 MFS transporter [Neorhizobium galegae bv. officinalis]MCM2501752.1 MFS transporter [Neorhizobium galegae]MCQ1772139.1 MFS transporter [Neorhizobium galegae]MCQ1777682.1 MFS transporter [Neorhizobium galegae]MCQ1794840.1 MFS transporter [Neorhizobium galegae]
MPKILPLRSVQTIAVLAVTQIISWGTTFDMLGVMGRIVAPELNLPNEVVFFGLSIMMLVSALAGPATGRLLGRHGAAKVMASASVLFAIGLLLLASAHEVLVYGLAWIVIGIGGALGLSAPAYTAVVEREGLDGKRIIAILMLFTGLSATIFWPVLALMNDLVGWRMTFVLSAALQIFVCLPLYLFGLPKPIDRSEQAQATDTVPVDFTPPERRRAFFLVAAATAISSFISFGLSPSLLALLQQAGASPALALQLGSARGAIGVSARFVDMALGRRGNALLTSLVGTALVLFSFLLAATVTSSAPVLVVFMVLYGFGTGVLAVARALLPLSLFSPREFGLQSARLSLPQNLANAAAPVIFTALLDRAGATAALVTGAVLSAISLVLVLLLVGLVRKANARTAA